MPSQKRTKVLIAGGSIAGLTLANILEKLDIDYLVLEKYGNIAPDLGASIGIFPHGFRILDQIGCHSAILDLLKGTDAFKALSLRNEHGKVISEVEQVSELFIKRLGYQTVFVDRQMIIQILYDNLPDKSKVLTSQGLAKVEQTVGEVKVITDNGDTLCGDLLVGADGIHSKVRREMWRLADQDRPGYFPVDERSNVPTEYCCIFGISHPTDKVPKHSSQNNLGKDYSYLIATGPNDRIYWFLFKKLSEVARGLYDKIPRYTDEQRDAMAAEHADDKVTDSITFGELYAMRTSATMQALPEVVFKKWHYNRITTIGDAAHKFNPISGHGGNSAIEDAAVLADQLHKFLKQKNSLTDADIAQIFEETQRIRYPRATKFLKSSHEMQSLHAQDTHISKFFAQYIIPLYRPMKTIDMICDNVKGAARIQSLPLPERPHSDVWDDERPEGSFDWRRVGFAASVAIAVLAGVTARNGRLPIASLPKLLLSIQQKA